MEHTADEWPTLTTTVVAAPPPGRLPLIVSAELFRQGGNTLRIAHADQIYQLRITRENKLILTK